MQLIKKLVSVSVFSLLVLNQTWAVASEHQIFVKLVSSGKAAQVSLDQVCDGLTDEKCEAVLEEIIHTAQSKLKGVSSYPQGCQ